MLLLCTLARTAPVQRLNYETLFMPAGQIQATTDYWFHTFQVQIPVLPDYSIPQVKCQSKSSQLCQAHKIALKHSATIINSTWHKAASALGQIDEIMPEDTSLPSLKRSLLPLGHVGKFCLVLLLNLIFKHCSIILRYWLTELRQFPLLLKSSQMVSLQ